MRSPSQAAARQTLTFTPTVYARVAVQAVRRWFARSQLGPVDNYVIRGQLH